MGKRGLSFDEVEQMALELPGVVARSSYGTPGLYAGKKFMARLREPDVMVLAPIDDMEMRFLMDTQPEVFFQTPHYVGHPTILIRLSKVDREELRPMIESCWRQLATRKMLAARESDEVASR